MQGTNNKGADQAEWTYRLVCAFVVHIHQSAVFLSHGPYEAAHEILYFNIAYVNSEPLKMNMLKGRFWPDSSLAVYTSRPPDKSA